ncbi:hypothetical protein BS47DRAFT_1402425 [Hydnum rufescens UP504]|uniref:Uncharacterized protein n=1 Tax=Hydnum rufescens UP504 TaxID=1448309 RepID=A0A9P6ACZ9_9AGAM|nr:hypothetical protein BS47DRAFT_1402425 [Hydnum rufescens UP504]
MHDVTPFQPLPEEGRSVTQVLRDHVPPSPSAKVPLRHAVTDSTHRGTALHILGFDHDPFLSQCKPSTSISRRKNSSTPAPHNVPRLEVNYMLRRLSNGTIGELIRGELHLQELPRTLELIFHSYPHFAHVIYMLSSYMGLEERLYRGITNASTFGTI